MRFAIRAKRKIRLREIFLVVVVLVVVVLVVVVLVVLVVLVVVVLVVVATDSRSQILEGVITKLCQALFLKNPIGGADLPHP